MTLDALFARSGQDEPDAVSFRIQKPDGSIVVIPGTTGSSSPAGLWEAELGVPDEAGKYEWSAVGTLVSEVTETIYGILEVLPSAVQDSPPGASTPPGPVLGPCTPWITGDDVAACTRVAYASNPAVFDRVAYEAFMALFEISGRQFTGLCPSGSCRPCADDCSCWGGPVSYGMGPWNWTSMPWGAGGGAWRSERGDRFGCKPMSKINLAGWPVREITSVTIDGADLPEFDAITGARNWRLDKWRYLVRMDEPAIPPSLIATPRQWPGCQNMSLDPDQPGTFEVQYRWGVDPPELGRQAAVEIANQLWLACNGEACLLPAGAVRVERQGITVERGLLANWADPTKAVGLVSTDLFLQAYWSGERGGRRPAVWSPDRQAFARRVGTGPSGS